MNRKVEFYKTSSKNVLVESFLDSLPSKVAQKITWVLSLLEDLDFIPQKYFKKLPGTDDIWGCRILYSKKYYRLLGFMYSNSFIILTHGFIKKSKKIPKKEIKKAEAYKKDYISRRQEK